MASPNSNTRPLWVTIYLNGDHNLSNGVKVNIQHALTLPDLCQLALSELNLLNMNITLTRVFTIDGTEIQQISEIYPDDRLWFSASENFEPLPADALPTPSTLPEQPINDPSQGYIYTAAVFGAGLVASGYGLMSSTIRSHGPQPLVNGFNSLEASVSHYTVPYVSSAIPYVSGTVAWSDKMLGQCIETTKQKTNQFLATPTGQSIQAQILTPLSDFTSHAVHAFRNATNGGGGGSGGDQSQPPHAGETQPQYDPNDPNSPLQYQQAENQGNAENGDENGAGGGSDGNHQHNQSYQQYLLGLKESMGDQWNNTLLPWAESTYRHLSEQVTGHNRGDQTQRPQSGSEDHIQQPSPPGEPSA